MRFVVVAVLLLSACPPPDVGDHVAPRVLSVEPATSVVPVTTTFRFTFSEKVNKRTISGELSPDNAALTVIVVPTFKADGSVTITPDFLSDLKNAPLIDSRLAVCVPVNLTLSASEDSLTVAPVSPLDPGKAFTVILSAEIRDTAGNPLVDASGNKNPFLLGVTTDAGPPAVTTTDLPTGLVVPNLKHITVAFNQPVQNVSASTLTIDGSPPVVVDAVLADATRTTATITLADSSSGCARLGTNASYTLTATAQIVGDNGQGLTPFSQPFSTASSCDATANVMSGVAHTDGDVSATIRFNTTKPSTSEVRFGVAGGALDCLGGPCPALGAPTTAANGLHTVSLAGLAVNVDYDFVATAEDAVGFIATGNGTVHTAPLPKISVNEVMADPAGTGTDTNGEYIELASFEPSAPTDLTGWTLRTTHGTTTSDCAVPASTTLAAGGFVILARSTFDASLYPGVDVSKLAAVSSLCSLVNTDPILVELFDPTGRPINSMSAPAGQDGKSVERIAPDAPDDASSFCYSRDDTGPTPGKENGVALQGCD